ncbi:hypothetical protein Tco_0492057 [Tanacetum coccineum]
MHPESELVLSCNKKGHPIAFLSKTLAPKHQVLSTYEKEFLAVIQPLVDVVDRSLNAREAVIDLLKFHINRSQDRMRSLADKHKSDREFEEGVWVYLKLQPYRQATLRQGKQNKLSYKYFGPFLIKKKLGKVAYKLQLPSSSQIHQVFHVSQLKLYRGPLPTLSSQLPKVISDGLISKEPYIVLDRRMAKKGKVDDVYLLIQWVNVIA